ncbi:MAG: TGS domain-containing protein, partial [Deltaproteobacteria bacterium]|nr:TGS domain-containing protein [Deltaproteobacteria bacterium]
MKKIAVTLPDGSAEVYQSGETVREIVSSRCGDAFKSAVAARVNGEMVDLSCPVTEDARVEL